jgi:1-acyl-sn-glycerol-3-phosphate acyltransferase
VDSWKTKYVFPALGMVPIDRSGGEKSATVLDTAAGVLRHRSW